MNDLKMIKIKFKNRLKITNAENAKICKKKFNSYAIKHIFYWKRYKRYEKIQNVQTSKT